MERLKALKGDIYRCIHCKACRFAYSGEPDRKGIGEYKGKLYEGMVQSCPAGIEYGWEAYWNAGKVWIARAILEGDLKPNEDVANVVYPCITCGMCGAQCENQVRTVDIIEAIRGAVIEAGVKPMGVHQKMKEFNIAEGNAYGSKKEDRLKWAVDAGFEPAINTETKIGYFVGCTAAYRQTNIAVATMNLLKKIGYDVSILSEESCCGSPFFRTGLIDEAQRTMVNNLQLFQNFDIIIFSCAGCYRTFTVDYPKWIEIMQKKKTLPAELEIPPKWKTLHAMELISKLVADGKVTLKENPELAGKVVTYHDPCHTGRHFGQWFKERLIEESNNLMMDMRAIDKITNEWFEVPRRIIKAIPGIEFREMYRIKMDSFCCGAGGGVKGQYPDFSMRTASLRLDEANAVGADYILTECPFCWRNLSDANDQFKHNLKVMTILEMLDTYDLIDTAEPIEISEALRENNAEKLFPSRRAEEGGEEKPKGKKAH